jgi:hypothetical protein
MKLRLEILAVGVAAVLCTGPAEAARADRPVEYLKQEPPSGTLPYGKVVYVDDGTCPSGEVKEITGGSQEKSIARKVRCVKRPD